MNAMEEQWEKMTEEQWIKYLESIRAKAKPIILTPREAIKRGDK